MPHDLNWKEDDIWGNRFAISQEAICQMCLRSSLVPSSSLGAWLEICVYFILQGNASLDIYRHPFFSFSVLYLSSSLKTWWWMPWKLFILLVSCWIQPAAKFCTSRQPWRAHWPSGSRRISRCTTTRSFTELSTPWVRLQIRTIGSIPWRWFLHFGWLVWLCTSQFYSILEKRNTWAQEMIHTPCLLAGFMWIA